METTLGYGTPAPKSLKMKLCFPASLNNGLKVASSSPKPAVLIAAHRRDLSVEKSYCVFYCISLLNLHKHHCDTEVFQKPLWMDREILTIFKLIFQANDSCEPF